MIDEAANEAPAAPEPGDRRRGKSPQRRSTRVEVNGWINLDKPVGVSSTQAVGRLKFLFNAKKAGHAGTLDPLASGVLPVAFGEATKTVPIVQEGAKAYRFRVRWGEESATDDAEGGDRRPLRQAPEPGRDRGGASALHRPDRADAADLFGDQDRRRARLRSGARRRDLRDRRPADPRLSPRAGRGRGRYRRARGGMRQGRLCAGDRPRPRPGARLLRPRHRTAAHAGRALFGRRGRSARPTARRFRTDGAGHASASGRSLPNSPRFPSTAAARRS